MLLERAQRVDEVLKASRKQKQRMNSTSSSTTTSLHVMQPLPLSGAGCAWRMSSPKSRG